MSGRLKLMQNAMTHTAVCGYLMGLYASMTQSQRMKFNTFAMSTTHCFQCGKIAPEFVWQIGTGQEAVEHVRRKVSCMIMYWIKNCLWQCTACHTIRKYIGKRAQEQDTQTIHNQACIVKFESLRKHLLFMTCGYVRLHFLTLTLANS